MTVQIWELPALLDKNLTRAPLQVMLQVFNCCFSLFNIAQLIVSVMEIYKLQCY